MPTETKTTKLAARRSTAPVEPAPVRNVRAPAPRSEPERRATRIDLGQVAAELRALVPPEQAAPVPAAPAPAPAVAAAPGVELNAPFDTRWAHVAPRFDHVVHVCHLEWLGIRAAAGYAPGRKVAITSRRPLTPVEQRTVLEACSQARVVVFHGFSPNMKGLCTALRTRLGRDVRLVAIWHGSTAQLHHPFELEALGHCLGLRHNGLLDGLAFVKPGMHLLSPKELHGTVLLNLPPRLEAVPAPTARADTALIPVPNDWRKNFYTNLFAACAVPQLERLYVTTRFTEAPELPLRCRVLPVPGASREQLFQMISESVLLLNASLSECQPMTALEGLAHGVPCVTGPLSLGALDRHPYQRLVQVTGVDSLEEVRATAAAVLEQRQRDPSELTQSMADFQAALTREALVRLAEFLRL